MHLLDKFYDEYSKEDAFELLEYINKQFGEYISLHGNIGVEEVLIKGIKEQVKQSVIEHINRLNINGGYIISSSHDINQHVSIEKFITMIETIHSL